MFKYAVLLAIGIAFGYSYGWKDAQEHDDHIVTRTVDRIGGESRGKYSSDIDQTVEKMEK